MNLNNQSKRGAQGKTVEASPGLPVAYANGLFFPLVPLPRGKVFPTYWGE